MTVEEFGNLQIGDTIHRPGMGECVVTSFESNTHGLDRTIWVDTPMGPGSVTEAYSHQWSVVKKATVAKPDAIEHLKELRDELNNQTALKLDDEDPRLKDFNTPVRKVPQLDPKGIAGKLKPQLQLVPPVILKEMAGALAIGAEKYGPWNWRDNKVEIMTYLGAMRRHIDAVLEGEDLDPESGFHHLGHVAAGCAIVLDAKEQGTLVDNRPPRRPEAK